MKKLTAMLASLMMLGNFCTPMLTTSAEVIPDEEMQDPYTEEVTEGVFVCRLYADHAEIIRCTADTAEVVIPREIAGVPVTAIGDNAFSGCPGLLGVVIPYTVTDISDTAFAGTSLTKIFWEMDLPSSAVWNALPPEAENYCYYVSYEESDEYTLGFCNSIAYRKYADHIEIYQMDYTLPEIVIPSEIEGLPVTKVTGLCNSGLIGSAYYYNHVLTRLTVPASVTKLGITGCNALEEILVDENNPALCVQDGNILFSRDMTVLYHYPACRLEAFYTVPETVTAIGGGAFAGCDTLQGITLPEGLRSIGDAAFTECKSLVDLTLPESLTELGNAFVRCYQLPYLEIPAGVTDLDKLSLFFCESLIALVVPATVTVFTDLTDSFGEPGLTDIYFGGTQQEWEALLDTERNSFDTPFENVTIHCDFQGFSLANLNGDAHVDASDAALLLKAAAHAGTGTRILNVKQEAFADLNADNAYNANDAALLLQYAAHIGTGGTMPLEEFLARP